MESIVNIIVKYLQKCMKYRSYHINFYIPDNSGLNRMIYNVKDFLTRQITYSHCLYDEQLIYQTYIALLYLSYNKFDPYSVEDNIEETYTKYKSITDEHADKDYTHKEYLTEIIDMCYEIMMDVKVPANIEHVDVPSLLDPINDSTHFQPGDNHVTISMSIDINNDSMIIDQSIHEIIDGVRKGIDKSTGVINIVHPADVIVERFKQFVNEVSK